jgi:glycosyltransferase involved in cell wall biosynthesis
MDPLVSIIIPCFNAKRWVAEAIQSSLGQTYQPIEVIVIDDGSTDQSLEVIRSFGDTIKWESSANRGGNAARNRGIALSQGEHIQFLDADDYILPEKIGRQVACLESTGADVVYGDWRHQHHEADGSTWLEDVAVSGTQEDILASLLSGWWVAPVAVLLRRKAVVQIGGWDESLKAAQDTDLMIRLAMAKPRFQYQPGCESIYRRYGNVTVGTSQPARWLENHLKVLDKASAELARGNRLTANYGHALAVSYFRLARGLFDLDRSAYDRAMARVFQLEPQFQPPGSILYKTVRRLFGFKGAERVACAKRRLRQGALDWNNVSVKP